MTKNIPTDYLRDLKKRLNSHKISIYGISKIIDEPVSTVGKIVRGSGSYAIERVNGLLEKINNHLDELDGKSVIKDFTTPNDSELFIKLYRLGLDSKGFTPDEKLKLALAHKELTQQKEKT